MTKDIEALAKIGEQVVLNKLDNSINELTRELVYREQDSRHEWEEGFRTKSKLYQEERDNAINLGLDVSYYEKEFFELTDKYSKITGGVRILLTREEERKRDIISRTLGVSVGEKK